MASTPIVVQSWPPASQPGPALYFPSRSEPSAQGHLRGAGGLGAAHEAALQKGLLVYQRLCDREVLGQFTVEFPSLRIAAVNDAMCTLTGFSAAEMLERNATMILPGGSTPDAAALRRLAGGTSDGYTVERPMQRRDGAILLVLWTVSAVRDVAGRAVQLVVLAHDLTSERTAEEAQLRRQHVLDAAVAALPVTVTTFDSQLRFTSVSGGLDRAGTRPEDFLGRRVSDVTDDPAALLALQQALAGRESTSRTLVHGQTYLTQHAPMRGSQGAVAGVITVSTNITAEVLAEAKRRSAEERTLFMARHDPLTGLPGRSALIEHLQELARSGQGAGALLLLDLDDFNLINDSLGHEVGDVVLLEVASRIADAFPGLMVARSGGDEFAVVAPQGLGRSATLEAANRLRAVVHADLRVSHHALRVTACVGVAREPAQDQSSTLIRDADSALAHAKSGGRNSYRLYDDAMRRQAQHRLRISGGLGVALGTGQLRLAYQPIVRLGDRRIIGAEALLRWSHPDWGLVPPTDFIPIAEQCGMIGPIGQWVMDTACTDMQPLQRGHGLYISVNVSARQLVGGFAESVEEVLERTGLPAHALTVEVTESALMEHPGPVRSALGPLRARGVRVSIDDFGTGYSSLARLQRLPVDVIKLDRAFITDLDVRAEARGMAGAILHLSAAIGVDIVAEGVETEAEAATLFQLGYTSAQGYLFARPMTLADLTMGLLPKATPGGTAASTAGAPGNVAGHRTV